MYLLDTNIILEFLLDQDEPDTVERFLRTAPRTDILLSEFSLYSLGVVLIHRKLHETFLRVVEDLLIGGGAGIGRLEPEDMREVAAVSRRFNLDFDDAYQYVCAQKHNLRIISFDSDFERTELGRKTPMEILEG